MVDRATCNRFLNANICWAFGICGAAILGVAIYLGPPILAKAQAQALFNQASDLQSKSLADSLDEHIAEERERSDKVVDALTDIQGDLKVIRFQLEAGR